jgi:hypothetical protein
MAEDLAIDVGFENGTDDYKSFVACINNILDYGCSYSEAKTQEIVSMCEESELEVAKDVIYECRKSRTGIRQTKLKWWQTYQTPPPTPQRSSPPRRRRRPPGERRRPMSPRQRPMSPRQRPMSPRQRPMSPRRRPQRPRRGTQRRMDLSFSKVRNVRPYDRPYRPSDGRDNESRKRPMSPLYDRPSDGRDNESHKRPMSPLYQSNVPEWPRPNKRRRR